MAVMEGKRGKEIGLLSAQECRSLGDGKYADGAGLFLIVRGMSRAWVLRYTSPDGRRREHGLGKLEKVSLRQARDAAAEARVNVNRKIDPVAEKAALRAAGVAERAAAGAAKAVERATLRRVLRDYHGKHVEPVLTEKHGKQWLASVETHVPAAILDKPIATINAGELLDALRPLFATVPETARRIRQRLDTVFDDAVLRDLAPSNPAKIIARSLRQKQNKGHFRALPVDQVHDLVARLRTLPGTSARALEFAIFTAARTSEVLDMEWSEISADGAVWTVPATRMKAGAAHVVYLSPQACAALDRVRGLSERWTFRSPERDAPLSNMAMLNLLRRLEVDHQTTVHGVARATFSTWAYETAAARPDVIEACLAHKETDRIKAAYNRAQFKEERRALLAMWADFIDTPPAATISNLNLHSFA
jgi:integrase